MSTTLEARPELAPQASSPGSAVRRPSRKRARGVRKYVLVYASAAIFALFSIGPILWGVSTSLKRGGDVYAFPPQWIPNPLTFDNYLTVLGDPSIIRSFGNTAIIAVSTTVLTLLVGILGAYGFSRHRFPGRTALLWSVLFTQLFPRIAVIVPFFVTLRNLNLMNTYGGLILVFLMVTFPISIWMIKGFFDRIPLEIEEAAVMDGASTWRVLWQIVLPMSKPALVAVAMYSFILAWNEFLFALVFTNGEALRPLSVALGYFIDDEGVNWGQLTAASILMSIPAIVVFTLSQKLLVRGLSEGAVKG
jgi:ABC-type glycerol-3-phosphate transport system permease component